MSMKVDSFVGKELNKLDSTSDADGVLNTFIHCKKNKWRTNKGQQLRVDRAIKTAGPNSYADRSNRENARGSK